MSKGKKTDERQTEKQTLFFFNVYWFLRERETQTMSWGRAERETETETISEAGSRLPVVSTEPNARLKVTNREIVTWAEVRGLTDRAPQGPWNRLLTIENKLIVTRGETVMGWVKEVLGIKEHTYHDGKNKIAILGGTYKALQCARQYTEAGFLIFHNSPWNRITTEHTLEPFRKWEGTINDCTMATLINLD